MRESKPESRAFLFAFTHERVEEALANLLRNARTVVDYIYDNLIFLRFQNDHNLG